MLLFNLGAARQAVMVVVAVLVVVARGGRQVWEPRHLKDTHHHPASHWLVRDAPQ